MKVGCMKKKYKYKVAYYKIMKQDKSNKYLHGDGYIQCYVGTTIILVYYV